MSQQSRTQSRKVQQRGRFRSVLIIAVVVVAVAVVGAVVVLDSLSVPGHTGRAVKKTSAAPRVTTK